ncbi:hypothetical protein chiPu_0016682 [Chiloscyllium punctatum]|uniref:Uncharacterized protein n=1 Tax=Chiloscyllium punctatum TaxID=137246 RepID=A0A401T6C0_CHIPU|nr:hypothetical protein [Chiloscyllium punctatum]
MGVRMRSTLIQDGGLYQRTVTGVKARELKTSDLRGDIRGLWLISNVYKHFGSPVVLHHSDRITATLPAAEVTKELLPLAIIPTAHAPVSESTHARCCYTAVNG